MFRKNALKSMLAQDQAAFGVLTALGSSSVAELCAQAGPDFVIIDGEHGLGGRETHLQCLQAVATTGATAILRVASHDPIAIKQALDMGPEALLIPDVRSADQARALVAACRYPPNGFRGFAAPMVRASDFGQQLAGYLTTYEQELMIIPMIESVEGARAAGEIAAVDGVDAVQFGPVDLAYDMGIGTDLDNPRFESIMAEAERAIRESGKPIGGPIFPGRRAAELIARGYRLFTIGFDAQLLVQGLKGVLERGRASASEAN